MAAGSSDVRIREEVASVIRAFYEAGKNKDLPTLMNFHSPASVFSKFDENPPYTRQSSDDAFVYEQASFANISDYEYKISDLRIDVISDTEDAAVATFYLTYSGVFVNDYSFEGRTVGSRTRVTMVLGKFGREWKIVHAHLSPMPDVTRDERLR